MSELTKVEGMTVIKTDSGEIKLSPKIIKQYLVRGAGNVNDQEVMMFLSLCKFQKLNPFLNEAYLVKFGNSPANIIVGKETFTKRAFNHPKFRGLTAGIIVERDGELLDLEGAFKKPSDTLLGGWAIVHVDGRVPFKNTVSMEEYNKSQSTWKQIPCTMIRKVALVQSLREAFPEYFQAMYSQEEMNTDNDYLDNLKNVEIPNECKNEIAEVVESEEIVETLPQNYIANIKITAKENNYGTVEYKALIIRKCKKESSKDLTVDEAKELVKYMKANPIKKEDKKEEANG